MASRLMPWAIAWRTKRFCSLAVVLVEAEVLPDGADTRDRLDFADSDDLICQRHCWLGVDHVDVTVVQGVHLRLLAADEEDVERLHVTRCITPVVGVSCQGDPLLWHPFDEGEGSRAHGDGIVPDRVERLAFEDVSRKDGAEQCLPGGVYLVEGEDDRLVVDHFVPGDQVVALPGDDVHRGIGDGLVGEDEVRGRHRCAIGPRRLLPDVVPDAEGVAACARHCGGRGGCGRGLRGPGRHNLERRRGLRFSGA